MRACIRDEGMFGWTGKYGNGKTTKDTCSLMTLYQFDAFIYTSSIRNQDTDAASAALLFQNIWGYMCVLFSRRARLLWGHSKASRIQTQR